MHSQHTNDFSDPTDANDVNRICSLLCDAFRLRSQFDAEVQDHRDWLAELMQQPDFLPPANDLLSLLSGGV